MMKIRLLSTALLCLGINTTPLMAQDQFPVPVMEMTGLVELEYNQLAPETGATSSDFTVATVEIGMTGHINSALLANIVLLYEEDDTNLELDVALLSYQINKNWATLAGQTYLPFGVYASNMISDSLTLQLAEIRETAMQLNYAAGTFNAQLYMFNGTNKQHSGADDKVDNWGLNIGYLQEGNVGFSVNLAYLNDIGDSDSIQDSLTTNAVMHHVAAMSLSAGLQFGEFGMSLEVIKASDAFDASELAFNGSGAEVAASMFEVGYQFELMARPAIISLGHQASDEALALGMPQSRNSLGLSLKLQQNTILAFEYAVDEDYQTSVGGTGKLTSLLVAQLAVEF